MIDKNDHVLDYVDAFLHDALSPPDKRRVASHCRECPVCRVALHEAEKRQETLLALPPIEASEALVQRTLDQVEQYCVVRTKWTRMGVLAAAAVVLVLGSFHLYFYTLAPSPYDLRLMGQTAFLTGADASLRILLLDRNRGTTQPGVPVEIDLVRPGPQNVLHLASFTTDQFGSGLARLKMPDWEPGKYKMRVRAQPGWQTESIESTITLRRSWQLMLTSDKPEYQPGQVIHLRSLALARPQTKPIAGKEATFAVLDPQGNVIFRKRDVTSRYGICSADCPLANEILEGAYQVRCELGDTTSAITVEVKKYVLPKFKIVVELNEPYYEPGQKVHGTLSAQYFFGKPLADADVEIKAAADDFTTAGIAGIKAKTDAQGKATFDFVLPETVVGRPQDGGDGRLLLTATVRDSAGQKQTAATSRIVTRQPIRIEVIPESGELIPGLPNTIYFLTTYPDGRPAQTRITVTGFDGEIKTNDLGAASWEITPKLSELSWEIRASVLHWLVRATDDKGRSGQKEVSLQQSPGNERFLVRTDKAVYDSGQTVQVMALGAGVEPLFLDLIRDGQTVLTAAMPVSKGRGEYQIDLPPEISGTLQLCAYRFSASGLPEMQTRVIYVRPEGGLKIEARLDHPEYRPGQQANLTLSVTDRQGKPVPSALGLSAVDEAVYSVQGSGLQPIFSSLEQDLLKPIYAIYRWSPELKSGLPIVEQGRFEKALFARAGQNGDPFNPNLKKIIQKFADGNEGLLRVLERPDWEKLAQDIPGMERFIPLIKGQQSMYLLHESTYAESARRIKSVRDDWLGLIKTTWWILGVSTGLAVFVLIVRTFGGTLVTALLLIVLFFMMIACLMPAVSSVRESARRVSAENDLRQLGLAMEVAEQSGMKIDLPKETPTTLPPVRVREWFPETLLWRPELITDDNGQASLTVDLADSITTWRLSASAVSAEGQLGSINSAVRVFQPFFVDLNLPVALTRGDEVAVPAVVYNYLDKPLAVTLQLEAADWFAAIDPAEQTLELAPGEVQSVSYRLRVKQVGQHELTVHASAGDVVDAIKRNIQVVPDGRRVEQTASGSLLQPADITWTVPADAIDGSVNAHVKFFPSTFSQLVDGLESIFQMPSGCFEQTSSTTYPNVLALNYLRRTEKSVPQVAAKAQQYIQLGYQRLLSFEIDGGGFDWFGHPPANRTLTAYGLMEFADMARVHDVDPKVIQRTRSWLIHQQEIDGSWSPEGHRLYEDPTTGQSDLRRLSSTAYVAWSLFSSGAGEADSARRAFDYLLRHKADSIDDPYVLALVSNALLTIQSNAPQAQAYLQRLDTMSIRSPDGNLVWWESGNHRRTMFYGVGRGGDIETTALASLAMIAGGTDPVTVKGALAWLISQKDARGTWYSTQATVLALKALLAGTDRPLGEARPRQLDVTVDGTLVETISILVDQSDVMQQLDLSAKVIPGKHRLEVTDRTAASTGYQATLSYHLPGPETVEKGSPLEIQLSYDKTSLSVNDQMQANLTVTNRMTQVAPMVILDLPIPAGFALEFADLDTLRSQGKIAKFQVTPRSAIVYLRELRPTEPLKLTYRLRAMMPVTIVVPPARAYEYYNPDHVTVTVPTKMTVVATK